MPSLHDGDLKVRGAFSADSISLPNGSITDTTISSFAAISAAKLQHQHQPCGGQPNTAAADETRALHVAQAVGTVEGFSAGSIVKAIGDATVTIDLHKNGVSILDSPITLNSSSANRVAQAATIDGGNLVAGDLLEVVIDATIGTGTLPTGLFWAAKIRELAD